MVTTVLSGKSDGGYVAVHLLVRGSVQGVGFRAATQSKAVELRLRGWVRNRSDGPVEIVAVGPPDNVRSFEQWCHRGPRAARVESVEAEPVDASTAGPFRGFRITR